VYLNPTKSDLFKHNQTYQNVTSANPTQQPNLTQPMLTASNPTYLSNTTNTINDVDVMKSMNAVSDLFHNIMAK